MQDSMRDITTIDPEWLYELAPHFYEYGTAKKKNNLNFTSQANEVLSKRMKVIKTEAGSLENANDN
ncbi:putative ATP-dependent RNA helicase DHX35 -like protein [Trichinella pseudospiralis]|nr:putative ATP-dependent RNA helicase DHX35 -like protein [Trichinella pseudospiralis]